MLLSFVIPCYHSAETLPDVVDQIRKTVLADGRYDYQIVLVNDNPMDATYRVIRQLCAQDERVQGICMSRNFGQHAALMAGYSRTKGDIVVSLDDDGQTPASEMFKLIDALDDETDVVYAQYEHKQHSLFRNFGSRVNDWMTCWLLDKPKGLYLSSYYAAKRFVVQEMLRYTNPFPYVDGLVLRTTRSVKNVLVKHQARQVGTSGYTLGKLVNLWLNGFTAFSVKPLRLATIAGSLLSVAGLLFTIVVVVQKILLRDEINAGWSSLVCLILIMGGAIMAMAGMLGEYIGRTYISLNAAPQYVVREECGRQEENE